MIWPEAHRAPWRFLALCLSSATLHRVFLGCSGGVCGHRAVGQRGWGKPKCFQVLMLQERAIELLGAPASWGVGGRPLACRPPAALGDGHTFLLSVWSRWPGTSHPCRLAASPPRGPGRLPDPVTRVRGAAGTTAPSAPQAPRLRTPGAWSPARAFPPPLPPPSRNWGAVTSSSGHSAAEPRFTMEQKQAAPLKL